MEFYDTIAVTSNSKGKESRKGTKESKKELIACPMCGAKVPEGAKECPKCEEPFTPEAFNKVKRSRGAKYLFWSGVITVLIGVMLALGSWLYDKLNLTFAGEGNEEVFGWYNRLISLIGIIILVIGIIFLILSLSKMEKDEIEDIELIEEDKKEQGG